MKPAQKGFTLLELMLVVTIAGLLLGLGVPAMGNYFRNARITAAANDVMAALHFTRSEAIKRRQRVTLCTSSNAVLGNNAANDAATCAASPLLTGWIVFVDLDQSGQRDGVEPILMNHAPMDTRITARSSADPLRITYQDNGFALNAAVSQVVLCDERGNVATGGQLSSARGIQVAVTGRAGVTRDLAQVQALIDAINQTIGGCTVS
ncbi:MAG: GspH/FimT family pseudopilin [Gammaproteobacteria bacterium]